MLNVWNLAYYQIKSNNSLKRDKESFKYSFKSNLIFFISFIKWCLNDNFKTISSHKNWNPILLHTIWSGLIAYIYQSDSCLITSVHIKPGLLIDRRALKQGNFLIFLSGRFRTSSIPPEGGLDSPTWPRFLPSTTATSRLRWDTCLKDLLELNVTRFNHTFISFPFLSKFKVLVEIIIQNEDNAELAGFENAKHYFCLFVSVLKPICLPQFSP